MAGGAPASNFGKPGMLNAGGIPPPLDIMAGGARPQPPCMGRPSGGPPPILAMKDIAAAFGSAPIGGKPGSPPPALAKSKLGMVKLGSPGALAMPARPPRPPRPPRPAPGMDKGRPGGKPRPPNFGGASAPGDMPPGAMPPKFKPGRPGIPGMAGILLPKSPPGKPDSPVGAVPSEGKPGKPGIPGNFGMLGMAGIFAPCAVMCLRASRGLCAGEGEAAGDESGADCVFGLLGITVWSALNREPPRFRSDKATETPFLKL
mmetsp:Transcript_78211/g.198770  ORF Transcript_78211/g.198770 Transcript_78211/m.198770 type:complete len:260 (-) Transcript_78211:796-1575(-)